MHDYLKDLGRGLAFLDDKADVYKKRQAVYDGEVEEQFGSAAVRKALAKCQAEFGLNFAATPPDWLARRIKLGSCGIGKAEGSTTVDMAAEDALRYRVMDANELAEDFDIWTHRAAYLGDYYIFVGPAGEVGELTGNASEVEVLGRSPMSTAIIYSRRNSRLPEFGITMWREGKRTRVNLFYEDETAPFISRTKQAQKADDFEPYVETDRKGVDLPHTIPHDHGFPLFHLRVDSKPYGTPVNIKAVGPQNAITKLVATHMGTVDFDGAPQRYALTEPGAEGDDAGDVFDDDGDEFDVDGVGEVAKSGGKLTAKPGGLWWLHNIKAVGQFQTADPENFLKPLLFYIRAMAKLCETPLYEFDIEGAEPSGESRRRADGAGNNHADAMKRSFGVTIDAVLEAAMLVLGFEVDVSVTWQPVELLADAESWKTLEAKVLNGVPLVVALEEIGYPAERIAEWYPDAEHAISPNLAFRLAEVFAKVAPAVTMGVGASAADVLDWFPNYIEGAPAEAALPDEPAAPAAEPDAPSATDAESAMLALEKTRAEALGILMRTGVDPEEAARRVGLEGVQFVGSPVSVRLDKAEAASLETA